MYHVMNTTMIMICYVHWLGRSPTDDRATSDNACYIRIISSRAEEPRRYPTNLKDVGGWLCSLQLETCT